MKSNDIQPDKRIDLELLIDYVEDSVAEDTRKDIDQYLNENKEERLVVDGIRMYYRQYGMDRASMLAYLQNTRDTSLTAFKEHIARKRTFPQWIGWAAAIFIVALGIGTYFFTAEHGNDNGSYLSIYLSEPYPVTVFLSDPGTEAWVTAYQSGDYQQSSALLDNLVQESRDNAPMLKYYAGLSHLYQHPPQPAPAIKYLSQVNEGTFAQQAHWFVALAYLLNEQMEEAQSLLENIVAAQAYHHEEAAELLSRISQE